MISPLFFFRINMDKELAGLEFDDLKLSEFMFHLPVAAGIGHIAGKELYIEKCFKDMFGEEWNVKFDLVSIMARLYDTGYFYKIHTVKSDEHAIKGRVVKDTDDVNKRAWFVKDKVLHNLYFYNVKEGDKLEDLLGETRHFSDIFLNLYALSGITDPSFYEAINLETADDDLKKIYEDYIVVKNKVNSFADRVVEVLNDLVVDYNGGLVVNISVKELEPNIVSFTVQAYTDELYLNPPLEYTGLCPDIKEIQLNALRSFLSLITFNYSA